MTQWISIDARGLEPPLPMVRILEAVAAMPDGSAIIARTDRRPMILLDELPCRGLAGESEPAPDGQGYVTKIRRV